MADEGGSTWDLVFEYPLSFRSFYEPQLCIGAISDENVIFAGSWSDNNFSQAALIADSTY